MDRALRQTHVAAALRAGRSAVAGFTPRQVPSSLCTGFPSFGVRGGHDDARFPGAALRRHTPMPLARPPQVVTQAVQALRRPMSAARERCLHSSAVLHAPTDEASSRSRSEVVDVLYDGECPLCVHEITWLRRRNQVRGCDVPMTFTDISLPNYDPYCHAGVTYEEGMKVMHVIKGGRVYSGVESFQVMYDAVGLGFIVKVLESPRVKRLADRVYDVWARLRLPMSGRPSLEVLLSRRSAEGATCASKKPGGTSKCD